MWPVLLRLGTDRHKEIRGGFEAFLSFSQTGRDRVRGTGVADKNGISMVLIIDLNLFKVVFQTGSKFLKVKFMRMERVEIVPFLCVKHPIGCGNHQKSVCFKNPMTLF